LKLVIKNNVMRVKYKKKTIIFNEEKIVTNLRNMHQQFFYPGFNQPGVSNPDRREGILKGWRGWLVDLGNHFLITKQRMSDTRLSPVLFNCVKSNVTNK
jgi:hypothetical protein